MSDEIKIVVLLVGILAFATFVISWLLIRGPREKQEDDKLVNKYRDMIQGDAKLTKQYRDMVQDDAKLTKQYRAMVRDLRLWGLIFIIYSINFLFPQSDMSVNLTIGSIVTVGIYIVVFLVFKDAAIYMFYSILLIGTMLLSIVDLIFFLIEENMMILNPGRVVLHIIIRLIFAGYFFLRFLGSNLIQTEYLSRKYESLEAGLRANRGTIDVFPFGSLFIGSAALLLGGVSIFKFGDPQTFMDLSQSLGMVASAMSAASLLSRYPRRAMSISGGISGLLAIGVVVFSIMPTEFPGLQISQYEAQPATPTPDKPSTPKFAPAPTSTPLPTPTPIPLIADYIWLTGDPADESFGWTFDVSNDRLIVGAPRISVENLPGQGMAFIFERQSDASWDQKTRLTLSSEDSESKFGYCVAIDDKLAVVSAMVGDHPGNIMTYIHTFEETDGEWARLAPIEIPVNDDFNLYCPLDIEDNVLVIGVPSANGGVGMVLVYRYINNEWILESEIHPPRAVNGGHFGSSLSIDKSGDMLAVSSVAGIKNGIRDTSAAAIFTLYSRDSDGNWNLQTQHTVGKSNTFDSAFGAIKLIDQTLVSGITGSQLSGGALIIEDISEAGDWTQTREHIQLNSPGMYYRLFDSVVAFDGDYLISASLQIGDLTSILHIYQRDPENASEWHLIESRILEEGLSFGKIYLEGQTLFIGFTSSGGIYVVDLDLD